MSLRGAKATKQVRNIRLDIDYLGRDYRGWQRQRSGPTVQGELEKALTILMREPVKVAGASRTDTGVHARGMAVNFQTRSGITADALLKGLNGLLPADIAVTAASEVDSEWHARKSAIYREYDYLIWNKPYPDVFTAATAYHVAKPLDVKAMAEAARDVLGVHDFRAFCVASSAPKGCVRKVTLMRVNEPEKGLVKITIRANGFVHRMVRSIVGTLIDIGLGKADKLAIKELLESGERRMAGKTAPARGLTLTKIGY